MITGFQEVQPALPILSDEKLNEFHAYQVSRIKCMREVNFCVNMLPVASALKQLAEDELKQRGLWIRK
ncbi:hypothetical protein UFOVP1106_34 [uncultured Caudovirales phage]|uniref:Uncharacterized protein n=1 Tax=uncultured Caudovirales phage TaxID=2100421 RepID=A0A6J5QM78_9CAUD|nr:hypothetical protein UFOVP1106_34 [uncultured Caudovirales phage]